jgi:hypothetical protein
MLLIRTPEHSLNHIAQRLIVTKRFAITRFARL